MLKNKNRNYSRLFLVKRVIKIQVQTDTRLFILNKFEGITT